MLIITQEPRRAEATGKRLLGLAEAACELGKPADLPVLDTPLGRLGLLTGEDVLYSRNARGLTYNGAEVILNPCRANPSANLMIRDERPSPRAGCPRSRRAPGDYNPPHAPVA